MSKYTTVRISTERHELLRQLAEREKVSLQAVLEQALEHYRRQAFLDDVNRGYASLSSDERSGLADELASWDATLSDGLEPSEKTRQSRPAKARASAQKRRATAK